MLAGDILLTGGAGFLGRGIVRRAKVEQWPCNFTIYSRDEQKQDKMRQRWPDLRYVLGDITDLNRLALVASGHDTIIHAAAIKYIPEGEFNVNECVRVNIDGTRFAILAARLAKVDTFVLVSTDKAVLPINTYGMTKAVAERLMGEAAAMDDARKYVGCRYGNVIGSTGSVIPVFKRQLETQGHVQITDPDMTRFWISVDDAVDLILEAALDAPSGSIVIPRPASMRLGNLATVIAGEAVTIVGKRPGEKMHEDLLSDSERSRTILSRGPGSGAGSGYENYWLLPPGAPTSAELAPRLTSEHPDSWVTEDEMLDYISDAETV